MQPTPKLTHAQQLMTRYKKFGFDSWYLNAEQDDVRAVLLHSHDGFLTVPNTPRYLPLLTPTDSNWLSNVQNVVHLSFMALIADVWTQILIGKRDSKEKPIYLLWDHEVPKPNRLTSLAWLLTCECWPMPNHKLDSEELFPPQPILLPQSTPYGHAGTPPHGFSYGFIADGARRSLSGLLAESMHRGDRENMAKSPVYNPIFRPKHGTAFGFHNGTLTEYEYDTQSRWPRTNSQRMDQGYGAEEVQESIRHLKRLEQLRKAVMSALGQVPGLPTHKHTLHQAPGMAIRSWSERQFYVKPPPTGYQMQWTPDDDSVQLEHGIKLKRVPHVMPRTWFGFTHYGPNHSANNLDNVEWNTASNQWALDYLKHRSFAIKMLFRPESIDLAAEVNRHTDQRAIALRKAGRVGKIKPPTGNALTEAARNAFASLVNKD